MAIKEGKKLHTFGSGFSPSILSSFSPCHCPRADTKAPAELAAAPITQGSPVAITPARAEPGFSTRALPAGRYPAIPIRALNSTAQAASG